MDRHPVGDLDWLDIMDPEADVAPLAEDPHDPPEPLAAADDSEPEEDPEEDPEEADYEPADVPDHVGEDSDNEGILEDIPADDARPVECLSEEEISILPSPAAVPYYQPYQRGGKGPWMMTTPGTGAQPDLYSFADRPIGGHGKMSTMHRTLPDITSYFTGGTKRKAPEGPAHYELGESSQTRPPHPPPADCACRAQIEILTRRHEALEDHIRSLHATSRTTRQRVDALEEEERQDTEAIRTLYHRGHATRTDVINLQVRAGHHEEVENTTQSQLVSAERTITELQAQNRRLQEQFDEFVRYMRARFGH